ncbi:MAG: class I SAM-dependent methyltransferase [Chlorobi bacterium]|nr:class I SAM-dependent methyltransferase [Chlorobiota bacterium]
MSGVMNMWDQRYKSEEYMYGKRPNDFFREQLLSFRPGKILLPAEGEGRNAVFAAKMGWQVTAFDSSGQGKKKAEKLARENNVEINYQVISIDDADFEENSFDLMALFFVHAMNRKNNHQKLIRFVKPGGVVLLEAFSKKQINNATGGPPRLEMLFSIEELEEDFSGLAEKKIWEDEVFLDEGKGHFGKANVIRLIGRK